MQASTASSSSGAAHRVRGASRLGPRGRTPLRVVAAVKEKTGKEIVARSAHRPPLFVPLPMAMAGGAACPAAPSIALPAAAAAPAHRSKTMIAKLDQAEEVSKVREGLGIAHAAA
jgi:hypothetical protein